MLNNILFNLRQTIAQHHLFLYLIVNTYTHTKKKIILVMAKRSSFYPLANKHNYSFIHFSLIFHKNKGYITHRIKHYKSLKHLGQKHS